VVMKRSVSGRPREATRFRSTVVVVVVVADDVFLNPFRFVFVSVNDLIAGWRRRWLGVVVGWWWCFFREPQAVVLVLVTKLARTDLTQTHTGRGDL